MNHVSAMTVTCRRFLPMIFSTTKYINSLFLRYRVENVLCTRAGKMIAINKPFISPYSSRQKHLNKHRLLTNGNPLPTIPLKDNQDFFNSPMVTRKACDQKQ